MNHGIELSPRMDVSLWGYLILGYDSKLCSSDAQYVRGPNVANFSKTRLL